MGNFDSMFGDRRNISDVTRDKYDVSKEDTQKNAQEIAILQSKREAMQSDKKRLETQKSYLVSQQKEAQAARDNAKARFDQAAASVQKELWSSNPDIRRNAENRVAADKQYLEETEATLKRITREIERKQQLLGPLIQQVASLHTQKQDHDQRLASLMPKKDVIIRVASQPIAKPEKVSWGAEKRLHDKTIKIAKNVDPVLVAKALSTYAQKKNIPWNQSITAEQIRSDLNLGNYKNLIIWPNTLAALDNFNSQNA